MITIQSIKAANAEAGYFFFSQDTMRFFASRVCDMVPVQSEIDPDLYFFVTTEKNFDGTRRYAHVRAFNRNDGDVNGCGADFPTVGHAKKAIKHFAKGNYKAGADYAANSGRRCFWTDPYFAPTKGA